MEIIGENRKMFLYKGAWHTFKGAAFAQMATIDAAHERAYPKRAAMIEDHGYDVKHACHGERLLTEIEPLLTEHDMNRERKREPLKAIRRGDWKLGHLKDDVTEKERHREGGDAASTVRQKPVRSGEQGAVVVMS